MRAKAARAAGRLFTRLRKMARGSRASRKRRRRTHRARRGADAGLAAVALVSRSGPVIAATFTTCRVAASIPSQSPQRPPVIVRRRLRALAFPVVVFAGVAKLLLQLRQLH